VARHLLTITMVKPDATYHAPLDCRSAGLDDSFTLFITRPMVTFNGGATFGKPDTAHARLSLGIPHPHLTEKLEVMQTAQAAR
jgi:bifunctional pyridoxal-dependent enzyme with beta-cystathionase and maltose regulon repressor activities